MEDGVRRAGGGGKNLPNASGPLCAHPAPAVPQQHCKPEFRNGISARPEKAEPKGRGTDGERVQLVRVLWQLLKYKEPFNPEVYAREEEKMKRKKLQRLETMATSLNYLIVPIQ